MDTSTLKFVRYEKRGRVALVTIDRPEVMNAIHGPTVEELAGIWADFKLDSQLSVAVLSGSGKRAFSTGLDLKWAATQPNELRQRAAALPERIFGGIVDAPASFGCWKPIVAKVNGLALGGGFELALAADIVVAADHVAFGLPEVRFGQIAAAGGTHRLMRELPRKLAMGLLLTGRRIDAESALQHGLINEVVASEQLDSATDAWVRALLECSPMAMQATKQAALLGLDSPLDVSLYRTYPAVQRLRESHDFVEGPRAFAEKREPEWRIE